MITFYTDFSCINCSFCLLSTHSSFILFSGYGVALPKGSPWRDKISLAILDQQEKGTIQLLYDKWWKNTGEICSRDEKSKESKANALGEYKFFPFFKWKSLLLCIVLI